MRDVICTTTKEGSQSYSVSLTENEVMMYAIRQYPDTDWSYENEFDFQDCLTRLGERDSHPQYDVWVTYHLGGESR